MVVLAHIAAKPVTVVVKAPDTDTTADPARERPASAAAGVLAQPISSSLAQQEPQTQQTCSLQSQPLADLAGLFESQKDDIDPFTLYGTNFKKYQIEQMEGEKVVSRSRGFTVDSCVSAVLASQETPEFNGLPTGEKVQAGDGLLCKRATGPDLNKACKQSCASACGDALARYEERMFAETGFKLEPKERERVLRNCRHSCSYECTKSGKAHDFVVPYRR
ncbi:hypothetical protein OEZ86_011865 [Tetradesmus obliquus]|uniref:Uncharacterized protein n=1 Tax=Tetradesmus obliquus TaxID=3088 RepID=A0ABY8TJX6_TETOB|nr:hypothetical protein OEZ85_008690 [Tetradesmus obliquus]WIA29360.1 hypothetical protein OEZ86_011865 [Tetradesmus obliquus]